MAKAPTPFTQGRSKLSVPFTLPGNIAPKHFEYIVAALEQSHGEPMTIVKHSSGNIVIEPKSWHTHKVVPPPTPSKCPGCGSYSPFCSCVTPMLGLPSPTPQPVVNVHVHQGSGLQKGNDFPGEQRIAELEDKVAMLEQKIAALNVDPELLELLRILTGRK